MYWHAPAGGIVRWGPHILNPADAIGVLTGVHQRRCAGRGVSAILPDSPSQHEHDADRGRGLCGEVVASISADADTEFG